MSALYDKASTYRAMRWAAIALGWTAVVTVLLTNAAYYWPLADDDDPYISFRYAWNLLHGNGLVWNVGEHFQGYSNFLWVILNAAVFPLTGDFLSGARVLSALSIIAIIGAGAFWLHAQVHGFARHVWIVVYALLVACCSPLIRYAVYGWEMALFPALLMWALALYDREMSHRDRAGWSVLLAFAMVTARSEGPLHLLTFAIFRLALFLRGVRWQRQDWMWWCRLAVLLGAYAAFQLIYFGSLKTGPYYAKVAGQSSHDYGREYLMGIFLYTPLSVFPVFVAVGSVMALIASRRSLLLWFVPCLMQVGLIWWFDGDMWPDYRLFAGFYPLLYLGLVTGCARWIQQRTWTVRSRRLAHAAVILLVLTTAFEQYAVAGVGCARFARQGTFAFRRRKALELITLKPDLLIPELPDDFRPDPPNFAEPALPSILRNTFPGETIVFPDIGFVGLTSRCRVLDSRGLTDPDAAMSAYYERLGETEKAQQAARRFMKKVVEARPAFIATALGKPPANQMLRNSAFLRNNYVRVGEINIHHYYVRRDRLDHPLKPSELERRWAETIALFPSYSFLVTCYSDVLEDYRKKHQ